jgi:hypothetical protein
MSDPVPHLAPRSAVWFVVAFLALFAGVTGFSLVERPKAATIETFAQSTAAGDNHYYQAPEPALAIPEPIFTWQGRPWAPVIDDKVKVDDPKMRRVARDETTGLSIYKSAADKPPGFFIKVAVGEFIRLQPR